MINVVHQRVLQVDQWTGETIQYRFKIPKKGCKTWTGCFGTPSTALSGLTQYIEDNHLNPDEAHELFDVFQASLRRNPGYETEQFTSQPAPSWKNLVLWGGGMTLEEYHKIYNHDFQVKAIKQQLPADEGTDTETSSEKKEKRKEPDDMDGETRPPNAPKQWRLSHVDTTPGNITEERVDMPRCAIAFIEFLRDQMLKVSSTGVSGSVTLYLHPTNTNLFAIGNPVDYFNTKVNKQAAELMGHVPVFGKVNLFHKNKFRESGGGGGGKAKGKKQKTVTDTPK